MKMAQVGNIHRTHERKAAGGATRRTAATLPLHEKLAITRHRDVIYKAFAKLLALECYAIEMPGGKIGLQINDRERKKVENMLVKGLGIDNHAASKIIFGLEKMFRSDWPDFKSILLDYRELLFRNLKDVLAREGRVALFDPSIVLSRNFFLACGEFRPGKEQIFKELVLYDSLKARTGFSGKLFHLGLETYIDAIAREHGLKV